MCTNDFPDPTSYSVRVVFVNDFVNKPPKPTHFGVVFTMILTDNAEDVVFKTILTDNAEDVVFKTILKDVLVDDFVMKFKFRFKFNAMKLMILIENEFKFKLQDTQT